MNKTSIHRGLRGSLAVVPPATKMATLGGEGLEAWLTLPCDAEDRRISAPGRWAVPRQTCPILYSLGTARLSRVEQANKEPERQVGSAGGREVRAARPLHRVTRPCPPLLPHSSLPHRGPSPSIQYLTNIPHSHLSHTSRFTSQPEQAS